MTGNIAPFVRIALRILGGYLIGRGLAGEDDMRLFTDPELVGAVTIAVSEGWYALAKWRGWSK